MHHEDWLYFCPLEDHVLYEFTFSSITLPHLSILSSLLGNQNLRLGLQLCLSFLPGTTSVLWKQITVANFALHRSTPTGEVTSYTLYVWDDKRLWIVRDNWDLSLGRRHFLLVTPTCYLTFHLLSLSLSPSLCSPPLPVGFNIWCWLLAFSSW